MTDRSNHLPLAVLAAVLGGVALAPSASPWLAGKKTDDRVAALEEDVKKIAAAQRGLDARVFHLEETGANLDRDLSRVLPTDSRWVELARGGREQWEFDQGGRVQIQFEGWSETGTFAFRMNSRAGETHAEFRPGFSLTAVDDLGDKRRLYTMTLHRIDLERDGRPARGLVSVVLEEK